MYERLINVPGLLEAYSSKFGDLYKYPKYAENNLMAFVKNYTITKKVADLDSFNYTETKCEDPVEGKKYKNLEHLYDRKWKLKDYYVLSERERRCACGQQIKRVYVIEDEEGNTEDMGCTCVKRVSADAYKEIQGIYENKFKIVNQYFDKILIPNDRIEGNEIILEDVIDPEVYKKLLLVFIDDSQATKEINRILRKHNAEKNN